MLATYEQDVVKWSEEQAKLLLAGDFAHLDLTNLAEEILDVGKSEMRELESRMTVLLMHLIKCAYQPERRGRSWDNTIKHQRYRIARAIKKTPSLQSKMDEEFWQDVWQYARYEAEGETGIDEAAFPKEMPWAVSDILTEGWYPPVSR